MLPPELVRQRQLDEICNDFEETWEAHARPDFSSILSRVEPDNVPELLRLLLEVDVELRTKAGQIVLARDYDSVHPDAPRMVDDCVRSPGIQNDSTLMVSRCQDLGADPETVAASEFKTDGSYELIEKIGEGGMGTVWKAIQHEPIRRQVALKFIKSGLNSRQVIARFEAERKALAVMNHPNIAAILDGGTTASGLPWFVMELVMGMPITTWCDQHRLGIGERLRLFIDVCQGLQHAHQKGIIHRDLKPSNMLVTTVDGRAVPKLIDFGLAKVLESTQHLTDESHFTGIGQILGTLKYMSPEQASLDGTDIDTRSDIYSMGAILYELLTGATPLDGELKHGHSMLDVLQVIRDRDPVKPGRKLNANRNTLSSVVDRRRIDPARLSRILTGDLDWIVMKALDKDRSRRYQTASEFSDDIQRYLNGEAVLARPPSATYRLRKFVARNRVGVVAAAALAIVLIGGIAGTGWGWLRALESERDSKQQFLLAEQARVEESRANKQAQKQLTQIRNTNRIISRIFVDLNVRERKIGDDPLEAVLAKRLIAAAGELNLDSVGDPLELAELQNQLGECLRSLGFFNESAEILHLALETRIRMLGADNPLTMRSTRSLASTYISAGNHEQAVLLYEKLLRVSTSTPGADHADTLAAMYGLAIALKADGKTDLALPLFETVLESRRRILGPDHSSTLASLNALATTFEEAGQIQRAVPLMEETLRLRRLTLGEDHVDTITALSNLANGYESIGDFQKALPIFEEALRKMKTQLGPDHPNTLVCMNNLASAYKGANRLAEALAIYDEVTILFGKKLGVDHSNTIVSRLNLGGLYFTMGNVERAIAIFEETLPIATNKLGETHPVTLSNMNSLAVALKSAGQFERALELTEKTCRMTEAKLGKDHPRTLIALGTLAEYHRVAGNIDMAIPILENVIASTKANLGDQHPDLIVPLNALALCYDGSRQWSKALSTWDEAIAIARPKLESGHKTTRTIQANKNKLIAQIVALLVLAN